MSADSEEGKCHKVYKQCVGFTSKGALENAMTQEKNMKTQTQIFCMPLHVLDLQKFLEIQTLEHTDVLDAFSAPTGTLTVMMC